MHVQDSFGFTNRYLELVRYYLLLVPGDSA